MKVKNIYVSQISDYIASMIEDEFYVVALSKSVTDKSGIPYYRLVLADKTGAITGIVWDQHMEQISENLIHTIVRIKAEVFNNKTRGVELIISEIKKVECSDISDFINRLDDQLKNKYFTTLRKMGEMVKNTSYKQLISIMISENENILKEEKESSEYINKNIVPLKHDLKQNKKKTQIKVNQTKKNKTKNKK